ncbi:hypothetical protein [uncultured Megasphaera sp.]|uniref:rolling circle replication-associated protein n=1 Tax=uncultured Megasphaera sp. TaxID=165188 RepID=UPI0025E2CA73|nr:hypothetical protein [uncultured Megasphaera sp.]
MDQTALDFKMRMQHPGEKSFIREQKWICGEYLEITVFREFNVKSRGRREKRHKSSDRQIRANEKNARAKLRRLINTNFGKDDLMVTLTYAPEFLPASIDDADRMLSNFLRRTNARRKKLGLAKAKYIAVTEWTSKKNGDPVRIHHHIIMDGALSRDEVENLWRVRRRKGESQGRAIGRANTKRLQPDECGMADLAQYLTNKLAKRKRWRSSQGLKLPEHRKNDYRWSRRKLDTMAGMTDDYREWQKLYPGYLVSRCQAKFDECRGWMINLIMRRDAVYDADHHTRDIAGAERIRPCKPDRSKSREPDEPGCTCDM